MRMRCITFRLTDGEHRTLQAEADKVGASVPLYARWRALDALAADRLAARLDALERLVKDVPDRKVMGEAFNRLAAKIAASSGKGGAS